MHRARRSFWILFLIGVLAAGVFSWSLNASSGGLAAVGFAVSALVLVVAIALDVRILIVLERRRVH